MKGLKNVPTNALNFSAASKTIELTKELLLYSAKVLKTWQ
jgi:hypothetical protein